MRFHKYHGLGNNFVILDDRAGRISKAPAWVRWVCDANRGVGADGILYLQRPKERGNDFRMQIINSDGSEAEMCGNGIRCLAKYVLDRAISKKRILHIETLAGIKVTKIGKGKGRNQSYVTVDMGRPQLAGEMEEILALPNRQSVKFTPVSMGNPHAVVFEKRDVAGAKELGPLIEGHERFPNRTNVEFLEVLSQTEGTLVVFERGCGITQACGTGACASAFAGVIRKRFKTGVPILLHLLGGDLWITVSGDLSGILMKGPAAEVFEGDLKKGGILMVEYSHGLEGLPPYLFAKAEAKVSELRKQGVDIISLGIGDPDLPTPEFIIDAIAAAVRNPENHQYSTSHGEPETRGAVSRWYKKRFKVDLDADKEVAVTIGSKEGLANVSRAFLNPGDKVLVPDPAYPVYRQAATILNNAVPVIVPLKEQNGFLPDVGYIRKHGRGAKMLYLNYPNNPTAAVADRQFMREIADVADNSGILLVYDNAYSEFSFGDYRAPSILEFTRNAIEFHSLSKTFNMTGHRIGMAAGHPDLVSGLKRVKSQLDSGAPKYIQHGAVVALDSYPRNGNKPDFLKKNLTVYQRRRDILTAGLGKLGLRCPKPKATFYVWTAVPGSSIDFCDALLRLGVVATPGIGFGQHGEGYVRFALTQPEDRIREAVRRMKSSQELRKLIES